MRSSVPRRLILAVLWGSIFFPGGSANADEVTLKNGTILNGTTVQVAGLNPAGARANNWGPVPNFSYWVIDDGVRRFFVHRRNVAKHTEAGPLGANVSFQLKHEKQSRTAGFTTVGTFGAVQPFDEFGRRTVTLATQKGMVPIIQGIRVMRPDFTQVESLTHAWDYCVDTKTLPSEVVQSIIQKSSNRNDPAERKAAVLFYVQAQMFNEAQEEVRQLSERFPDMASWCEEYQRLVGEYIARKAINEIERRQESGQHLLANQIARQFPVGHVSAEIRQKAQEVVEQYDQALINRDRVLLRLDILQAELPEEQFMRVRSLRASLQDELHYELMPRLEPFLRAEADDTLQPSEKLALAYSGWVLGDSGAILDLNEAIRLWDARFLTLEYLRLKDDSLREQEILESLDAIEGISPARMAILLEHLPLPFQSAAEATGTIQEFEVTTDSQSPPVQYSVTLPPEYSPAHRYPMLVVLRGERSTIENEIRWWAGDAERPGWAQRRGYIIVAPHYCADDASSYDPGNQAHDVVLKSIDDVRKRFRVDSDRIFLAGHGMGGNACFDIGLSHPGLFAAVIPIGGISPRECRPCWDNAPRLSWYVVGGERDRNTLEKNADILNDMMKNGQDVLYCEYKERGYETYHEEQERLFTWMQSLRRTPLKDLTDWSISTPRNSDGRFHWIQAKMVPDRPATSRPPKYEGAIKVTGKIYVCHPGKGTSIWLSPELFDFNNRCEVHINHKQISREYIKPTLEAMLSDLRSRGDRERLYWARLDF
ncbi:alpha/beta hydrolase-fold protein [Planctomicrobium sp. SH661]|uniref:carboxylesterase family protein n=1 Tax=Planctomicrobium sp. SH661 TaxID=3448124 RepID=UPI003F5B81AD